MAQMINNIIIENKLRPCVVKINEVEKRALFHRWSDQSDVIAPSLLKGGHSGGTVRYTVAIVEYEDGRVAEVSPTLIRFLDNPKRERDFSEREAAEE